MGILSEQDAADYTDLSQRTLQRYRVEGGGPTFTRLGARRIGYMKADLDAWLNARKFPSRAAELSHQVAA